jgi:hypothetical protein
VNEGDIKGLAPQKKKLICRNPKNSTARGNVWREPELFEVEL